MRRTTRGRAAAGSARGRARTRAGRRGARPPSRERLDRSRAADPQVLDLEAQAAGCSTSPRIAARSSSSSSVGVACRQRLRPERHLDRVHNDERARLHSIAAWIATRAPPARTARPALPGSPDAGRSLATVTSRGRLGAERSRSLRLTSACNVHELGQLAHGSAVAAAYERPDVDKPSQQHRPPGRRRSDILAGHRNQRARSRASTAITRRSTGSGGRARPSRRSRPQGSGTCRRRARTTRRSTARRSDDAPRCRNRIAA